MLTHSIFFSITNTANKWKNSNNSKSLNLFREIYVNQSADSLFFVLLSFLIVKEYLSILFSPFCYFLACLSSILIKGNPVKKKNTSWSSSETYVNIYHWKMYENQRNTNQIKKQSYSYLRSGADAFVISSWSFVFSISNRLQYLYSIFCARLEEINHIYCSFTKLYEIHLNQITIYITFELEI